MIHYHGTPITGPDWPHLQLARRHAMVSFAAPQQIEVIADICQSFTLDNGAFSAWTRGEPLDVDGFREWSGIWSKHPACDWFLIPDVIDGDEAENDAMLDGWGLMGVPVWHLHESLGRLERLCNDFPRVAFGSSGDFATVGNRKWWVRMAQAMEACCDSDGVPITKLHGLRMLDPEIFSRLPFASADSTNVARNIGIDSAWRGTYTPASKSMRAAVLMERIEMHPSATRWIKSPQLELIA
jgi:hypothetical protein